MFDMNEFEREYRGFINQLRERKTDKSIPIKISEAKIVKPNNMNERYSNQMENFRINTAVNTIELKLLVVKEKHMN